MTRKHFEAIAQNIAHQVARIADRQAVNVISAEEAERQVSVLRNLAHDLSGTFRTVNPNFNTAKFLFAAGVA